MGLGQFFEQLVVLRIAGAEDDQLDFKLEQVADRRGDEIESLLIGQPRDHADNGHRRIKGEGGLLGEGLFVFLLVLEGRSAEFGGDEAVFLGIPDAVIDPVEDAAQVILALQQHPLQTAAQIGVILDLGGVGGTDRGDQIGAPDPGLEKTDLAEKLKVAARLTEFRSKSQLGEHRLRKDPLEGEIVDGEDRDRLGEKGIILVLMLEHPGDEGRLPVVAVDDMGFPMEKFDGLQHRLAKEEKTLGIVGKILAGGGVDIIVGPFEKGFVIEKIDLNLGIGQEGRFRADDMVLAADADGDVLQTDHLPQGIAPFADVAIFGHHHTDIMPLLEKSLGKSAGHIGQSPGLGKRCYFGR